MKCAIYARVSTKDGRQDTENQLGQLRAYCKASGWTSVEFIDHETGKHADRSGFIALFAAASRREFDVVLVWALDRFSREGIAQTFAHVDKLSSYKVMFESLTEPQFRNTGPTGELMMAISAWIAKQERIRISDRTKAGLATAKAKGRPGGRRWTVFRRDVAQEMRDKGMSWRAIARELDIDQSVIRRALANAHSKGNDTPKKGVSQTPRKAA